jgi:predicted Zn-dependent protease
MTASTSSSNVDVTIKMFDYGNSGYAGAVICPVGASKTGVDPRVVGRPMELRYNTDSSVAYLFDSQFERRYVACHELGHTVGLRHSGDVNSCMYTSALSTEITLHDTVMIQDAY